MNAIFSKLLSLMPLQKKCHRNKQGKQSSSAHPLQMRRASQVSKFHRRMGVCNTRHKRTTSNQPTKCTTVGAYCIRPELRGYCNVSAVVCKYGSSGGIQGVCHTPLQLSKYHNRPPFPNTAKTTSDVGKTMSYVEKIMSDIIQTTSDLFSTLANI